MSTDKLSEAMALFSQRDEVHDNITKISGIDRALRKLRRDQEKLNLTVSESSEEYKKLAETINIGEKILELHEKQLNNTTVKNWKLATSLKELNTVISQLEKSKKSLNRENEEEARNYERIEKEIKEATKAKKEFIKVPTNAKNINELRDAHKNLSEAIEFCNRETKEGRIEYKAYASQLREIDGELEKHGKKLKANESFFSKVKTSFKAKFSSPAELAANMIPEALSQASTFGKEFTQTLNLVPELDKDFVKEKLKTDMFEIASQGQDISLVNTALADCISSGQGAKDAINSVAAASRLAIGSNTDLSVSVSGINSVMDAFGIATSEADRIAELFYATQKEGKTSVAELSSQISELAPLFKSIGNENEMMAAVGALTKGGLKTPQAIGYLKKAITSLIKPTEQAKVELTKLGIPYGETAIKAAGFTNVLKQLSGVYQKSPEDLSKVIKSMDGFATSAEGLTAIQTLSGKGFEEYRNILQNVSTDFGETSRLNDAYTRQQDTLSQSIERGKAKLKEFLIVLGEKLAPIVSYIIDKTIGMAGSVKNLLSLIGHLTAGIIAYNVVLKAENYLTKLNILFKRKLIGVTETLNKVSKKNVFGLIAAGITMLITGLVSYLNKMSEVEDAIEEYNKKVEKSVNKETSAMKSLFEQLKRNWNNYDEKQKLLKKINTQYGTYLPNLLNEKTTLEEINKIEAKALKLLERKTRLKLRRKQEEQITEKIMTLEDKAEANFNKRFKKFNGKIKFKKKYAHQKPTASRTELEKELRANGEKGDIGYKYSLYNHTGFISKDEQTLLKQWVEQLKTTQGKIKVLEKSPEQIKIEGELKNVNDKIGAKGLETIYDVGKSKIKKHLGSKDYDTSVVEKDKEELRMLHAQKKQLEYKLNAELSKSNLSIQSSLTTLSELEGKVAEEYRILLEGGDRKTFNTNLAKINKDIGDEKAKLDKLYSPEKVKVKPYVEEDGNAYKPKYEVSKIDIKSEQSEIASANESIKDYKKQIEDAEEQAGIAKKGALALAKYLASKGTDDQIEEAEALNEALENKIAEIQKILEDKNNGLNKKDKDYLEKTNEKAKTSIEKNEENIKGLIDKKKTEEEDAETKFIDDVEKRREEFEEKLKNVKIENNAAIGEKEKLSAEEIHKRKLDQFNKEKKKRLEDLKIIIDTIKELEKTGDATPEMTTIREEAEKTHEKVENSEMPEGGGSLFGLVFGEGEEDDGWQAKTERVLNTMSSVMGVYKEYSNYRKAEEDAYLEKQEENAKLAKDKNDQLLEDGLINKKEHAERQAAIDKDLEAKKDKIEKDRAAREKKMALASAVINTALGITKAFPNPVAMAIIAAAGAFQIATIMKTKAFAKGGRVTEPTHALIGEAGPEEIYPSWQINHPKFKPIFEQLSEYRDNKKIPTTIPNIYQPSIESGIKSANYGLLKETAANSVTHNVVNNTTINNESDSDKFVVLKDEISTLKEENIRTNKLLSNMLSEWKEGQVIKANVLHSDIQYVTEQRERISNRYSQL